MQTCIKCNVLAQHFPCTYLHVHVALSSMNKTCHEQDLPCVLSCKIICTFAFALVFVTRRHGNNLHLYLAKRLKMYFNALVLTHRTPSQPSQGFNKTADEICILDSKISIHVYDTKQAYVSNACSKNC